MNAATARRSTGAAARVPLGEDQREAVEQHVAWKRTIGRIRGGRRGTGDVEQAAAGAGEVPGEQRRAPRIEIGVAGEAYVERLELLRRLEQQQRGVAAAALREHDLGPEQIDAGSPELVERPGLRGGQEPASNIERSRAEAGLGGRERPVGSPRGVARQRDRTLQERGRGGLAAARLRPDG